MKLHDRLILNKYFLSLFGVNRFADLRADDEKEPNLRDVLFNVEEDFEDISHSNYLNSILNSSLLDINSNLKLNIEKYDKNIMEHVNHINTKRDKPIVLTYFQYLAILFTEIFLDRYYNDRKDFIVDLNNFVDIENEKIDEDKNKYSYFYEEDLNKLAFYMATGERVIIVMGAICVIKSRVSGTLNKYISCTA